MTYHNISALPQIWPHNIAIPHSGKRNFLLLYLPQRLIPLSTFQKKNFFLDSDDRQGPYTPWAFIIIYTVQNQGTWF